MSNKSIGNEPVYDARTLGAPRMFVLGLQHMFAMFGATVLVPALSGLDVATTLLFAGLGTLLFHLLTKGKVPAFLGSSFAFIGGYNAVRTIGTNADGSAIYNNDLLAYACFGVAIAGLMYIILSSLFKIFGVKKVMRYFPPIVTGPIIIAIGLTLSSSAITNCRANWLVAVVAILIVIGFNMWGKGMAKIIPILLGVLGSYIFALIVDPAERASVAAAVSSAKWFGLPIFWKNSVFHLFAGPVDSGVLWSAVLTVVPLSLATMVEHIGDICAISSTCGKNFMVDPGFHRTLLGDGLATTLASLFGAPANTTYGENTGVLALSRVYDPRVIRIAAILAMCFSFSPKFAAIISSMPGGTIGGVITCVVTGCPPGVGEPEFGKLNAMLGGAMLSINAAKGFEIGDGFACVTSRGSQQNDVFRSNGDGTVSTVSNHSGGIQGGISNGEDIFFRTAFKPVATILTPQHTVDRQGVDITFCPHGRHDPCVLPRAVPVVEAMTAMTILDYLMLENIKIED